MHRKRGLWDAKLFDFGALYGAEFGMNKAIDFGLVRQ